MFKVFIDYGKMVEICLEQDESNGWYQILSHQSEINIDHSVDDESFYSEDNPLLVFSQMTGVEFVDSSPYMQSLYTHGEKVLDQPCGAFVLNVNKEKAKEIQETYGVICQSIDNMNSKFLTVGDVTVTTTRSGKWKNRFHFGNIVPSNSLLIVDRYLFRSELGETLDDSYENIRDILDAFLPDQFGAEYHVCFIVDASNIEVRDNADFRKISTNLNKIKKDFFDTHGYPIVLELLSCDNRDKECYSKLHDRKIISNYFYVTASHKLKAYRSGNPLTRQKIDLLSLYAKGLNDYSDIPEEAHADDIKDLRYVLGEAKAHPTLHDYSVNGNVNVSVDDAKNRILI